MRGVIKTIIANDGNLIFYKAESIELVHFIKMVISCQAAQAEGVTTKLEKS
jgi:hypothetical protein